MYEDLQGYLWSKKCNYLGYKQGCFLKTIYSSLFRKMNGCFNKLACAWKARPGWLKIMASLACEGEENSDSRSQKGYVHISS